MNSLITSGSGSFSPKSFWERKEGTAGMIFIVAACLVGGTLLYKALPFIINFLGMATIAVGQGIVLVGLLAVLGAILYVLFNERFRVLMTFMFMSAMRKLTSVFVELDPIGILKGYLSKQKDRKAEFDLQKTNIAGQKRATKETIEANNREIEEAQSMMIAANKRGNTSQVQIAQRNSERLAAWNERLTQTLAKITLIYNLLVKYSEACDIMIQDMTNEVKMREKERKLGLATSSAIGSARKILMGASLEAELYDEATEFLLNDYAMKMGEMDDFIVDSKSIMESLDLKNGMLEEKALAKIAAFENGTSRVLGDTKNLLIEQSNTGVYVPMQMAQPQGASVGASAPEYNRFFKQ